MDKKAFTLIELMIVVALVYILAGFTLQLCWSDRSSIRSELDMLYQACLFMQRHAMITRKQQDLTFDLYNHSYSFNARTQKLKQGVCFGIIAAQGPPSHPTKPLTQACTFKNNRITFYPDGIIDAGAIYLTNKKHNALYALTVAVSPYSYLRTYCYADTWRLL